MYSYKTIILDLDGILYDTKKENLYEGITELFDGLKNESYIMCICTDYSIEKISNVLEGYTIGKYFTSIKSTVQGLMKSQLIKQILDENSCSSAIFIGHAVEDFQSAEDTGCISIGAAYGYRGNYDEEADFTARNAREIYSIIKKINGLYKDISDQILYRKEKNKPLLLGINGVDTSGKTTFTKELERYLSKREFKTQLILMDDFHNLSEIRNKESDPIMSYTNNAFDLIKIEKELLKPIAEGVELNKELTLLDIEEDKFTSHKRYIVDGDTIILFEGVLLYREPLNQYFHLRLFIDISFDEVLKRAKKRDEALFGDKVIERYNKKYIPIQKLYIEKYKPKEISDIIIDNEDYLNPMIIKKIDNSFNKQEKIKLVKFEEQHFYEIKVMLQDEESRKMVGVTDIPELEDYLGSKNIWYTILNEQQEFLGVVELFNISWKNRRAELSITIKPSMRGKGYGYEAIKEVLKIGFDTHGMNRIWLRVLETNKKAVSLYKKLGFVQEGLCRGESLREGRFINQIQMSMLAEEWRSMR